MSNHQTNTLIFLLFRITESVKEKISVDSSNHQNNDVQNLVSYIDYQRGFFVRNLNVPIFTFSGFNGNFDVQNYLRFRNIW